MKYIHTTAYRDRVLAAQRRRYAAKVAAGLCVYPGCADLAAPNRKRCTAHLHQQAKTTLAYEIRREEGRAA